MKKYRVSFDLVIGDTSGTEKVSIPLIKYYLDEAVVGWKGCYHPSHPMFQIEKIKSVKVKLYAKSTKRK